MKSLKFLKILFLLSLLFLPATLRSQTPGNWWNDAVFYEIFVRSFYDANGDGKGDFRGLIQKLDYLNDGDPNTKTDLGITGIWLMPINPSPSYHGYDVNDYRGIASDYGTMNDFKEFLVKAHQRGIKVIIDLVMNHTSRQNPWFAASTDPSSPYRNYYIWRNTNPGYTGTWGQTVWHPFNSNYYFGMFSSGMPDLDYSYAPVKNDMFNIVRYWLDTLNVDGFRLDAIKHLFENGQIMEHVPATFSFLQEFRTYYKSVDPNAFVVGEVWSSTAQVVPYSNGTRLDACFEFDLASAIINAVKNSAPAGLANKVSSVVSSYQPLQYATFLSNHDQDRVYGILNQNEKWMKLAASVYLTLPGIPFIYYGEEIGMNGYGQDQNKRRPMPWTPGTNGGFTTGTPWYALGTPYTTNNIQTMSGDPGSILSRYRNLIHLRNKEEALRRGGYRAGTSSNANIYSFGRDLDNEVVYVIHNFSDFPVANFTVSMNQSNLDPGNFFVYDLESGASLGQVTVNFQGGFAGFAIPGELAGKGSMIIKLQTSPSGIENESENPGSFNLYQNFPNPFNPSTTINYTIARQAFVDVSVYDIRGNFVKRLLSDTQEPGSHTIEFAPNGMASGVYLVRVTAGAETKTIKATLLK
ncbi:MAG: T9SS type A sorting domain-containing protein [Ignavibacteria bacterium]|nr:T9SS type A sorting domain-containing protein [Ignavibacteria bacterium]